MSLLRPLLILVLAVLLGACAAPGTPPGSAATTPPSATDGAGTGNDRGPIPGAPRIGGTRDDDPGAVDRSCTTDADCTVKNVGNCCGYYPACVNADSPTDPEGVQARCAAEGRAGVCGFPEIASCQCVQGSCQASRREALLE